MTLGNKIRNRREELGLTQPELAEQTKLTQGYISRVENDKFIPKASTLLIQPKRLKWIILQAVLTICLMTITTAKYYLKTGASMLMEALVNQGY